MVISEMKYYNAFDDLIFTEIIIRRTVTDVCLWNRIALTEVRCLNWTHETHYNYARITAIILSSALVPVGSSQTTLLSSHLLLGVIAVCLRSSVVFVDKNNNDLLFSALELDQL